MSLFRCRRAEWFVKCACETLAWLWCNINAWRLMRVRLTPQHNPDHLDALDKFEFYIFFLVLSDAHFLLKGHAWMNSVFNFHHWHASSLLAVIIGLMEQVTWQEDGLLLIGRPFGSACTLWWPGKWCWQNWQGEPLVWRVLASVKCPRGDRL